MLVTRGFGEQIWSYQMFTSYRGFWVSCISKLTIPMKHVYGPIIFNLCSRNVQYSLLTS